MDLIKSVLYSPQVACYPSLGFRWFRPRGGNDNDLRLQQRFQCSDGTEYWGEIPIFFED